MRDERRVVIDWRGLAAARQREDCLIVAQLHPVTRSVMEAIIAKHPNWGVADVEGEAMIRLVEAALDVREVAPEVRSAAREALNLPERLTERKPPAVGISIARGSGVAGERADGPRAVVVPSVSSCGRFR